MLSVRAVLFYTGYTLATIIWGTISTLVGWLLPYRFRFRFIIGYWTAFCLSWLRLTCGIRARVTGLENVPERPCIVFCRHESTWETLFLQRIFWPQATLIKRELLHIPFFGWAFRALKPIAINRKEGRKALRTLIKEGGKRLADDIWVVLFPEGTRMPPEESGAFSRGERRWPPPPAHRCWSWYTMPAHSGPAHAFLKHPGEIQMIVSEPIVSEGRSAKEIQAEAAEVFDRLMATLPRGAEQRATAEVTRPD